MTPEDWDEIDLSGLEMEDSEDADTGTADEKQRRLHERLDISNLLELTINKTENIPIEVIPTRGIWDIKTGDVSQNFKATLLDISAGGIRILSEGLFPVNHILKMNFNIGNRNITIRGTVRWANTNKGKNVLGIEFINPNQNDIEFISSIHSALLLREY